MKIIHIVPGFGGTFYCGNCLRDSAFVKSVKATGHDAMTIPLYLPLSSKTTFADNNMPVFYGAVNIYLQQKFRLFRKMPGWLHDLLNSKPILKYAAKKAGSTRAAGLEEMTISMLKGSEGHQRYELQKLIEFLKEHEKPDVVHLSNALLLGLARKIRKDLQIPVVCSLQDEDVWVDAMEEPYRTRIWQLLSEKGNDVDAFVAVSDFYAGEMKKKMNIPENKVYVVHIGIDTANYKLATPDENIPVIGYLSRMNKENGFEVLIDAFIELKDNSEFKNAKLKLTGGKTGDDNLFINKQIKKLKKKDYLKDVEFVKDFSLEALSDFFNNLTVLTVPVLDGEAFGLYQLEALASGVPLVQPALGAFPEVIEATAGGVVYQPNTSGALAKKYIEVFSNPEKLKQMRLDGKKNVIEKFSTGKITEKMINVYEKIIKN